LQLTIVIDNFEIDNQFFAIQCFWGIGWMGGIQHAHLQEEKMNVPALVCDNFTQEGRQFK
jgi:hypothetical protein